MKVRRSTFCYLYTLIVRRFADQEIHLTPETNCNKKACRYNPPKLLSPAFKRFADQGSTLLPMMNDQYWNAVFQEVCRPKIHLTPEPNSARLSEVYRTSTFSAFRTLKLRGLQIKDPPLNSQLYDQVVNHTGMYFCFPLWKGLRSKDRLNFSCFRIIPFWILTTKSGFQSSAVVSHIFLRFVTLKWQRKFEPLALAALVALSGSAEYLPMMFFENLSKSVRLHLTRFYRKAGTDLSTGDYSATTLE